MNLNWVLGNPQLEHGVMSCMTASTAGVPNRSILAPIPLVSIRILQNLTERGVLQPRTPIVNHVVELLLQSNGHEERYEPNMPRDRGRRQRLLNTNERIVLIRGVGGMGKTTVAALATSSGALRRHFCDGVCWITVGQRDVAQEDRKACRSKSDHFMMSYDTYVFYLKTICREVSLSRPQFEELVSLPGDDDTVRVQKTRQLMQNAQQEMSHILGPKRVLIVLDDVWHEEDINLFNFGTKLDSNCRLLVTTRMKVPSIDMKTVDLSALEETEAVDLLFKESGLFNDRNYFSVSETDREAAHRVVKGCGCHPIAVRAAGRLLYILESAAFDMISLSNLDKTIDEGLFLNIDPERALFDMLDRSFAASMHGELEARAMKRCLSSFATVFSHNDCLRPWVPFHPVLILWNALLSHKELKAFEDPGKNVAAIILERLETLGLINSMKVENREDGKATIYYQIHHEMMRQFAVESVSSTTTRSNILHCMFGNIFRSQNKASTGLVLPDLHQRLVQGLLQQEEVQSQDLSSHKWKMGKSDSYTFVYLPLHLIMADQPKMAEDTLANVNFVKCRVSSIGVLKGAVAHVRDVEELNRQMHVGRKKARKRQNDKKVAAGRCFDAMASHLRIRLEDDTQPAEDIGEAFLVLGKALQRQSQWAEAMILLAEAIDCYQRSTNDAEGHSRILVIQEHIRASTLPELALLPRESPDCVKLKYAEKLRSLQDATAPRRRHVDRTESIPLELSSHPELGIVLLSWKVRSVLIGLREVGIGPAESSIQVAVDDDGCFIQASDRSVLCSVGVNEGNQILLLDSKSANKRMIRRAFQLNFVVNGDGGISPARQPHLALGFGLPRLCLVPRNSPARLILKHAAALKQNTLPTVGYDLMPDVEGGNVFETELVSHPGRAIVKSRASILVGSTIAANRIGIGPMEDAFRLVHDGRRLADPDSGFVMKVFRSKYQPGIGVLFYRNTRRNDTIWEGGGIDFTINDDGSVSPMHAPNLAVGAPCLAVTNEVVTTEQKNHADAEAKKEPPPQPRSVLLRELRIIFNAQVSFLRLSERARRR